MPDLILANGEMVERQAALVELEAGGSVIVAAQAGPEMWDLLDGCLNLSEVVDELQDLGFGYELATTIVREGGDNRNPADWLWKIHGKDETSYISADAALDEALVLVA